MDFKTTFGCPRCGSMVMKSWHELNEDEREIVRRLPASAKFPINERKTLHHWCVRCWFESSDNRPFDA